MSPELVFWLALTIKMAVTALSVSVATVIAERLGAVAGALAATLPVSAAPVYVFLALDHDAAFISASAVASLALNTATAIFITVYVLTAQRRSLWISTSLAITVWLAVTLALVPVHWTAPSALVLNLVVFALGVGIVKPYGRVAMPPTIRPWYDLVIRAGMVALLVGAVVTLSFRIGPTGSGVLAVFPVIYTSITLILHGRVGRSCYGRSASECYFRPCRFWRSVANAASRGSAAWISPGPHFCPQRLRCLECRPIYIARHPQILGLQNHRPRPNNTATARSTQGGQIAYRATQRSLSLARRVGSSNVCYSVADGGNSAHLTAVPYRPKMTVSCSPRGVAPCQVIATLSKAGMSCEH